MKTIKFVYSLLVMSIVLAVTGCTEKEMDDSPAPAAVTNLSYVKTNGGAIITYKLPTDKNLLFVRAEYMNSQNEEVSKVASRFDNKIEIDGYIDLNKHTIKLYSIGKNGKESAAASIDIVPDTSHIELIMKSLRFEPIVGGVKAKWYTPSKKTVFIYVDYSDGTKAYQRILSSSDKDSVEVNIRGLDSIPYNFSITVEDFSHNKTQKVTKGTFKPKPEFKIDKKSWKVLTNFSANGTSGDGKIENFIDDIIDTQESAADNSYFIVNRGNNGGSLMFFSDLTVQSGKPLMMVVDMGKQVMLSRFVCWQRAYDINSVIKDASGTSLGISSKPAYYKDDNLKSFIFYATNNINDITALNVWNNPLMICDLGGPFTDGFIPDSKIREAKSGHEFILPEAKGPYRYFVMGLLSSYGSEIQTSFSEISLYGVEVK